MFGELGDSDILDNEPNYGFDEFYSGDGDRQNSSQDDDFWDAGSFDAAQPQNTGAPSDFYQNEVPPVNPQPQVMPQGQQNTDNEQNAAPQQNTTVQQEPQKKSGTMFLLILLLLVAGAAGMFYYKKNISPDSSVAGQAEGDYFYDKAAADNTDALPQKPQEQTATVDVNLSEPSAGQPAAKEAAKQENPETQDTAAASDVDKPVSALEKAMQKKKNDEKKENQLGLSSNPVIVPVSAGGRVDPFMPYLQQNAVAKQPKFELIAPPTVIPEPDPVVDELVQTKISGIMYDPARPSAIVNFGDSDQLVHKGDTVKGYKIVNITKNSVVIKYKNNIYQATVGQSLDDGVNLNPVSGLSNQFGGLYNKSSNVIQFNNTNN